MSIATPLSFSDRLTVWAWRHVIAPGITAMVGSSAPRGRVVEQRYGDLPDETLDVIAPARGLAPRVPVVFIHGGGWVAGSKGRLYHRPLVKLADAGYPVFSLNYPLAPERPHPYMLRSVLAGLAWLVRTHAAREVHLVGDSAGGNLAMMLGLALANPELLARLDSSDPATLPVVRSITSLYGVMDRFTWIEEGFPSARVFLHAYGGVGALSATHPLAIPVTPMDVGEFVNLPPTFVVAASKDQLARSSKVWADHLRARFAQVKYTSYEGASHGFFSFGTGSAALSDDLRAFLDSI